jgi:hypothetical protein
MNTYKHDLRDALRRAITIPNDALLYRVVYRTRFGETRRIELLTFVDAIQRRDAMIARALHARVELMFAFDKI